MRSRFERISQSITMFFVYIIGVDFRYFEVEQTQAYRTRKPPFKARKHTSKSILILRIGPA